MKESFLHFVWQFQKFESTNLTDSEGNAVQIFSVGEHNTNAGPDFLNARIKIGDMVWYGHVELHVKASFWNTHGHQTDNAYDNVILHVVWENDQQIEHKDGKLIPTIILKNKVNKELLLQSDKLLGSSDKIPCSKLLGKVEDLQMITMQEKVAIQRLETKSDLVFELLKKNAGDWEETTYQLLSQNFGFKVNAHPFLKMAQKLLFKVLKKHCGNSLQVEALLFGVGGFLNDMPKDDYHSALMNEYVFLAKKYSLEGHELNPAEWKYLRLRPANFPTVRLSQLATLINNSPHLFDAFTSFDDVKKLIKELQTRPSKYWTNHFDFGKKSKNKLLGMGVGSVENMLINTAPPLLSAYAKYTKDHSYLDKAINLLQKLKPEKNNIINKWNELNIAPKSAFESQSLIELYNNQCLKKKCLSCNIGASIINNF